MNPPLLSSPLHCPPAKPALLRAAIQSAVLPPPMPFQQPRRRKRLSVSCDRCRRLKRKCNRAQPCSLCVSTHNSCTWQGRGSSAKATVREDTLLSDPVSNSRTASSSSSDAHPRFINDAVTTSSSTSGTFDVEPSEEVNVEALLNLPAFVNAVLTIWFRELDWMYDIVGDTEAEKQWRRGDTIRSTPLLLAICAVVCQLYSSDLEAAMIAQGNDDTNCAGLGKKCYDEARLLIERDYESESAPPLEHFQASLLLCAYTKTAGKRGLYRDMLYRDISRLQRSGLHRQSKNLSPTDEALANRIFWAYFTYDRLYFMIEDLPYGIGSHHADVWLQDEKGVMTHVQDLCSGLDSQQQPSGGNSIKSAPHMSLSLFVTSMVKLAALVGRYSDRLSTLRHVLGRNSSIQPEEIASQAGQELARLEQHIYEQIRGESHMNLSPDLSTRRVKTLHPSQHHVIAMTIAKIKRDIATRLIQHLQDASLTSLSLHYQRIHSANQLLQLSLSVASKIPMRQMGWGFFLFYTFEPIVELLDSLARHDFVIAVAADHLSLALSGRNLLIMIARETKLPLAERLAGDICLRSAQTLRSVQGVQQDTINSAESPNRIVPVQKTVELYRKCLSIDPFQEAFDTSSSSSQIHGDSPSMAASMQALDELLLLLSNPVLA